MTSGTSHITTWWSPPSGAHRSILKRIIFYLNFRYLFFSVFRQSQCEHVNLYRSWADNYFSELVEHIFITNIDVLLSGCNLFWILYLTTMKRWNDEGAAHTKVRRWKVAREERSTEKYCCTCLGRRRVRPGPPKNYPHPLVRLVISLAIARAEKIFS